MIRQRLLAFVIAAGLPAAGPSPAWAGAPATPTVAATSPASPPLPEPARDWAKLFSDGNLEEVAHGNDLVSAMYEEGELKSDCDARLADVEHYLARVPVAVALWDAAGKCARAKGDTARADRYDEAVARLAAHAFASDSSGPWEPPIAVTNINDAYALAGTTGMEVLHIYLDPSRFPRHYAIVLVLWDEEAKVERHLAFDFLDVLGRLRSDERFAGYPVYRAQMREGVIKAQAENKDLLGIDVKAVRAASGEPPAVAVAALRDAAAAGGVLSLTSWLKACNGKPVSCGEGAVDALLPLAEENIAIYRVFLALAQARGIGTRRDEPAAFALLDSAEARWPGHAHAQFAEWWMDMDDKPLPKGIEQRLQRAAAAGSRRANAARLRERVRQDKDWTLDADSLALASSLAEGGLPAASYALYRHYAELGKDELAIRAIRRSAESGDAEAMRSLAYELFDGDRVAADWRAGVDWMGRAAHGGDSKAMDWMADRAMAAERWSEAEAWYASEAMNGEADGLLGMATLYSRQRPGVESGPAKARDLFRLLVDKFPSPQARRAYAYFLLTTEPKDLKKARDLLVADAATDAYAQVFLGLQMLRGRFGASEVDAGIAWVQKAVAAKPAYGDGLANHLYYRVRTPEARQRALKIERALVVQNSAPAINNLGWWLCVSPDAAVRNPAEGLAAVKRLPAVEKLEGGVLDTVAACHAATGDFVRAEQVQALAVERLDYLPTSPDDDKEIRARLALYRQRQAYVERPEDEDRDED